MNPDRFARLKEILLTALDLPADERAKYIESIGREDESLGREAKELLARENDIPAAVRTGGLARLVDSLMEDGSHRDSKERIPEVVGPYRIRRVLGEGGMGVVYLAEQTEPIRREVALKLIRGGADSAAVLARFDSERQSLAQMSHPNIATVLDAGSDAGRPYFVMELVNGVPITDYCRKMGPRIRPRLRVFLDVCRAVRHAHRRGIIHRDLKPSNILVAEVGNKPVPKVIDFSLAKALADPTADTGIRTRTGQILGTLEYMSPEQARGAVAEVDTRSDVYSLGVVLYELITGRRLHDLGGVPLHEAVQRIVDEPSILPGRTTTGADRDLDTILGKCLEKESDRRYGSAAELVEDLERFLDSRPILARPPTASYQLRKLITRHRVVFGIAAGAFLLLAGFAVTVSVQLGIQNRERQRAEAAVTETRREARRARRINEFLQEMLASAAPDGRGSDLTVRQLLDETAERVDRDLTGEPEALADAHHTLGVTYGQLGDDDQGLIHLHRALELHKETSGDDSNDAAEDLRAIAEAQYGKGNYDEANAVGRKALKWWRLVNDADGEGAHPELPALLQSLALIEASRGEFDEAERFAREAVERVSRGEPDGDGERSGAEMALAEVLWNRAAEPDLLEAESLVQSALEARKELLGPDHPDTLDSLNLLGLVLNKQNRKKEFLRIQYENLLRHRRSLDADHPLIAVAAHNLATALLETGYLASAAPFQEEALGIWQEVYGEKHPYVIVALANLGYMNTALGRAEEAERIFRDALARAEQVQDPQRLDAVRQGLRVLLLERGERLDEAEEYARAYRALHPLDPDLPDRQVAWGADALGLILLEQGRLAEAETLFREAVSLLDAIGGPTPGLSPRLGLSAVLARTKGKEAALPYLLPVEEHLMSGGRWGTNQVRHSLRIIEELREGWGDTKEAEACRREMARRDAVAQSEPDLTTGLAPDLLEFAAGQ